METKAQVFSFAMVSIRSTFYEASRITQLWGHQKSIRVCLMSQTLVIRGSRQSAQCWCDRNLCGWYPCGWYPSHHELLPCWALLLPCESARHVRIQFEKKSQKLLDTPDKLYITLFIWFAYQMTESAAIFRRLGGCCLKKKVLGLLDLNHSV